MILHNSIVVKACTLRTANALVLRANSQHCEIREVAEALRQRLKLVVGHVSASTRLEISPPVMRPYHGTCSHVLRPLTLVSDSGGLQRVGRLAVLWH